MLVGSMLSILGIGSLAATLAGQASVLERLEWMAGCWDRVSGDRWLEEQWMRPRGGMMLGMSRTVRGERVVGYEALRIEERVDGLVYVAHPSGQAVAEFGAVEVSDTLVAFENREHDFPQRIVYRRGRGDSLFAQIEGGQGEEMRRAEFRMSRARCSAYP